MWLPMYPDEPVTATTPPAGMGGMLGRSSFSLYPAHRSAPFFRWLLLRVSASLYDLLLKEDWSSAQPLHEAGKVCSAVPKNQKRSGLAERAGGALEQAFDVTKLDTARQSGKAAKRRHEAGSEGSAARRAHAALHRMSAIAIR